MQQRELRSKSAAKFSGSGLRTFVPIPSVKVSSRNVCGPISYSLWRSCRKQYGFSTHFTADAVNDASEPLQATIADIGSDAQTRLTAVDGRIFFSKPTQKVELLDNSDLTATKQGETRSPTCWRFRIRQNLHVPMNRRHPDRLLIDPCPDETALPPEVFLSKYAVACAFKKSIFVIRIDPKSLRNHISIQSFKPVPVLAKLSKDGAPLAARTCGHAHKVLHLALARAVKAEVIARNVAAVMKPPKVDESEVQILRADQIGIVTAALDGHWLKPMVALATGMRRGEILALAWGAVDLDKASIRIERSLEQTKAGLAFKSPKTKTSKRMVSLPPTAVEVLREHRRQQLETRLQLGQGKPTLVFSNIEGEAIPPMNFSRDFARFVKARQLPAVTFHALRHTHVSALISAGVDVLTISRRIGHANAAITLKTYSHLFAQNDSAAVDAIEAALRGKP
jgi:integrase